MQRHHSKRISVKRRMNRCHVISSGWMTFLCLSAFYSKLLRTRRRIMWCRMTQMSVQYPEQAVDFFAFSSLEHTSGVFIGNLFTLKIQGTVLMTQSRYLLSIYLQPRVCLSHWDYGAKKPLIHWHGDLMAILQINSLLSSGTFHLIKWCTTPYPLTSSRTVENTLFINTHGVVKSELLFSCAILEVYSRQVHHHVNGTERRIQVHTKEHLNRQQRYTIRVRGTPWCWNIACLVANTARVGQLQCLWCRHGCSSSEEERLRVRFNETCIHDACTKVITFEASIHLAYLWHKYHSINRKQHKVKKY